MAGQKRSCEKGKIFFVFLFFEQRDLCIHFAQGPANYVAILMIHSLMVLLNSYKELFVYIRQC